MTFPTTGVLDNFNRANEGPPPSASWASPTFWDAGGLEVFSNQCRGNIDDWCNSYWKTSVGPDSEVYCSIPTLPGAGKCVTLHIRLQTPGTAGIDGYELCWQRGSGAWIVRIDNEAETEIWNSAQEWSAGDAIGFEAIGNTLTVYRKPSGGAWAQVGASVNDATYAGAGCIGLGVSDNVARLDDFGGGTVVVAGGVPRHADYYRRRRAN